MSMVTCWFCGNKFFQDQPYYWVCPEHLDEGLIDVWGEMGTNVNQSLGKLMNAKLDDEMLKQLADSAIFPKLAAKVLPLMEARELTNLLAKVLKEVE